MRLARSWAAGVAATLLGCGAGAASLGPRAVDLPVSDGMVQSEAATRPGTAAPPPGATRPSPFPAVGRARLDNGLQLDVVTAPAAPLVHVRLLVRAGAGSGPSPSLAPLAGRLLREGGSRATPGSELLRKAETLGADLSVRVDLDATVLALAVTRDRLDQALALLAQAVREPRFDDAVLARVKAEAIDEAASLARSSASWAATRLVFRELFPAGSAYATWGLVPSEIAGVDAAQLREFHRLHYVPGATTLVLAGDVDLAAARALAAQNFGAWTGAAPPSGLRGSPPAGVRGASRLLLAHRPRRAEAEIYLAVLAPARASERWPAVQVAARILGGGVTSRVSRDLEVRGLAARTSAAVLELAQGDQPLVLHASAETAKTEGALSALLDSVATMSRAAASAAETESAVRQLRAGFARELETAGSIADLVVTQEAFGLPEGYWDTYRESVRATEASEAAAVAKELWPAGKALVVVAGDADAIGPALARFGEVTVVDPEREFKTMRTLPEVSR